MPDISGVVYKIRGMRKPKSKLGWEPNANASAGFCSKFLLLSGFICLLVCFIVSFIYLGSGHYLWSGWGLKINGRVTEKISRERWGRRIIFDHGGSVKTYTIFKHKHTLALLFSFGGVKKFDLNKWWVKFF